MSDSSAFREDLAALVRQLLEESPRSSNPVGAPIREHLGVAQDQLTVHTEELSDFELPNLQLALDAALGRPGWDGRVYGLAGFGGHHPEIGLGDLMANEHLSIGPPAYVNAPVGPGRTLPCLVWAVVLVTAPEGRLAVLVNRGQIHGMRSGITVQAAAGDPELASRFLADLRALMDEHDVFRGQLMAVEVDRDGSRRVVFHERPTMDESELVLPEGLLNRVVRHVVGPTRHREELLARGRHLARGLLLWGPPGTGKTHTVRYLTGLLTDATVIVLSGPSLGLVGAFGALARRLPPAMIVLEDVDLVASERTFAGPGSSPLLFELMNEMSGLAADADVAFILTTNRPDALEPALAARPGRVDLALEIPLPEASERRRLLELYGRGLDLDPALLDDAVARTEGATASFFRELLRKAAVGALEAGHEKVGAEDLGGALDELLHETASLTRVLLGSEAPGEGPAPTPHEWLQGMAGGPHVRGVALRRTR